MVGYEERFKTLIGITSLKDGYEFKTWIFLESIFSHIFKFGFVLTNAWVCCRDVKVAFIENTFRYALVMQISEDFFNVSFPGIVYLTFWLVLLLSALQTFPFPVLEFYGLFYVCFNFFEKAKKSFFCFFFSIIFLLFERFVGKDKLELNVNITLQNKFCYFPF